METKHKVLAIIIFLLVLSSLSAAEKKVTKIDKLIEKEINKTGKERLEDYYFDKEKGIEKVKSYKESEELVIIYFDNTSWRVITSKEKFYDILKKDKKDKED